MYNTIHTKIKKYEFNLGTLKILETDSNTKGRKLLELMKIHQIWSALNDDERCRRLKSNISFSNVKLNEVKITFYMFND